jgi:hypothetical protein
MQSRAKKYVKLGVLLLVITIGGVFAFLKYSEVTALNAKIAAHLKDPAVGDSFVIKIDTDRAPYTIIKIIGVEGNRLKCMMSEFSFERLDGVRDQFLNPQLDRGRETFEIEKDKLSGYKIVDVYGKVRWH